ncbi:MAG TPA: metallopeptidase TldD-related protein [Solirubrobacteraceae bacterium]|nr:metallopeptidase TldD-related protein [Solirubrobacteraceae bacterium]
MKLAELAERALERTRGQAQVTVTRERSQLARFAGSRPTQATEVDELRVEVVAVRDGATAAAATSKVDNDGLREVGDRAARAAQAAARAGGGAYPGLPAPSERPRAHEGWDPATARLEPSRPGAALAAVFEQASTRRVDAAGVWTAGAVETALASSTGLHAADATTDAHLKVLCRDGSGRSGFAAATATSCDAIDPAAVARAAADKTAAGEPAQLALGEHPAVLDADAVGSLLEFLAALALNGLAHAEGRGALCGRLGKLVASPAVNLSDSPRYPGTLPRAIDAEGVGKSPLALIQDGVAHRVVHDTRSAAIAGGDARSTGHALAPGGAPRGPRPTNLVLVGGGAADVAALAGGIERGIYVTRLWYVNTVHAKQTLLTGMTRDGTFLIEDGRITRPLRDLRFTDSVLGLLERVEGLTAQPRLTSEAEFYGPRFATGVVCPAVRVGALRITGTTA